MSVLVVRTAAGERVIEVMRPDRLTLLPATPGKVIASQAETIVLKREVYRGRMCLRSLSRRPLPHNPGIPWKPSLGDRLAGMKDLAKEAWRYVEDARCA